MLADLPRQRCSRNDGIATGKAHGQNYRQPVQKPIVRRISSFVHARTSAGANPAVYQYIRNLTTHRPTLEKKGCAIRRASPKSNGESMFVAIGWILVLGSVLGSFLGVG